jgi:hypothetical protein
VDHKMAPEVAAERGVVVGQPYTPPGRTGTFDVPSYDDIADLQVLFKRFANTAASFTEAGGGPFVDKTGDFTVDKSGLYKTYLCLSSTLMTVTVPDPATLTDGDRFNLIQGGTGKAEISGTNVVGLSQTAGQYQGVTATVHDGKWWCVPFGSSGGGATGPIPVFPLAESVTVDVTQAGGLLAMDSTLGNLQVTIPQSSEIPVGSAYVVSNVGSSSKNRVTVKSETGVTILNRQSAVVERFRIVSLVKQVNGADISGNDVWLLNAGGGGGGGAVPLAPRNVAAFGVSAGVIVSWEPPEDDGGTPITQYSVEISPDGNVSWELAGSTKGDAYSFTVDDLVVGKTYGLRVKAANESGFSDPSSIAEAVPTAQFNEADGGNVTTYKAGNRYFKVHTFTDNGNFTVVKSVVPFNVLVVGGGSGAGSEFGSVTYGGDVLSSLNWTPEENIYPVVVGVGGNGCTRPGDWDTACTGTPGAKSSLGDLVAAGGSTANTGRSNVTSNISGVPVLYGSNAWTKGYGSNGDKGGYQYHPENGGPGYKGVVIVSYEIAPFNEAEGGAPTTYTKDGKKYKVHTFTDNSTLIVKSAARPFRILCVGAGAGRSGGNPSCCGGPGCERGPERGGGGNYYLNNNDVLGAQSYPVVVGVGGGPGNNGCCDAGSCGCCPGGGGYPGGSGGASSIAGKSGAGGTGTRQGTAPPNYFVTTDISGTNTQYGNNGGGDQGGRGIVIVSYEIDPSVTDYDEAQAPEQLSMEGTFVYPSGGVWELRGSEYVQVESPDIIEVEAIVKRSRKKAVE